MSLLRAVTVVAVAGVLAPVYVFWVANATRHLRLVALVPEVIAINT